jgi:CubicO group peptidase (beta-lactamase class C family)
MPGHEAGSAPGTEAVAVSAVRERPVRRRLERAVTRAPDWSALDTTLASFVPAAVGGLTFALCRSDEILFARAYGGQTLDTVLPIASSTKVPSAAAIMTLVDQGVLDLDEPVATYLAGRIDWPADKAAVTTRMLLNHTSGLAQHDCLGDQRATTLEACAEEIGRMPLQFAPGTMFAYGGSSFQVAGYVAEVLSGQSWAEFFAERVAEPLGLTRFTYTATENPRIAGGAQSDVGDYVRILQVFLGGGTRLGRQVLSAQSVARMLQDQKGGLPVVNSPGGTALPGYSFGWWISDPILHPGSPGPELSDQGAFGCTPWVDLGAGYGAIVLIQDRTSTGTEIWNAVRPLILEELRNTGP